MAGLGAADSSQIWEEEANSHKEGEGAALARLVSFANSGVRW